MDAFIVRKVIRKMPGEVIRLVPIPKPVLIEGAGVRSQIGELCREAGYGSVLLVTDEMLYSLNYHQPIVDSLAAAGVACTVFHGINSEPTTEFVAQGRRMALDSQAQCLVALGGGSVMDTSKMIASAVRLKRLSRKAGRLCLKFLIVPGGTLPMITVPSTAGTGAESTVGAVIKKNARGAKGATVVVGLNVTHVLLDSDLTKDMPRAITAACGIDALSHGVEGCLADVKSGDEDLRMSRECVRLVLANLPKVLENPSDEEARQLMCRAAYYGGNAINKQLAGYVHAFAHSIGAMCHISHGNAIALSLLPVLEFQQSACREKMAALAVYCGLATEDTETAVAADSLLEALRALLELCDIRPAALDIDEERLVGMVAKDSINYSAPVTMSGRDIQNVLHKIIINNRRL